MSCVQLKTVHTKAQFNQQPACRSLSLTCSSSSLLLYKSFLQPSKLDCNRVTRFSSSMQTVPRKPVPNWGMPAYINNSLVWGSPPKTPPVYNLNAETLTALSGPSRQHPCHASAWCEVLGHYTN